MSSIFRNLTFFSSLSLKELPINKSSSRAMLNSSTWKTPTLSKVSFQVPKHENGRQRGFADGCSLFSSRYSFLGACFVPYMGRCSIYIQLKLSSSLCFSNNIISFNPTIWYGEAELADTFAKLLYNPTKWNAKEESSSAQPGESGFVIWAEAKTLQGQHQAKR